MSRMPSSLRSPRATEMGMKPVSKVCWGRKLGVSVDIMFRSTDTELEVTVTRVLDPAPDDLQARAVRDMFVMMGKHPRLDTAAIQTVETKGWDAWKNREVKGVEEVMAKDFMYFSGKGRLERADAIKGWSEPKCTGLGYTFAEPMGIQLSPDAALVTYKANVQGTCDGIGVSPTLWVASFDVKEDGQWKNAFYTDLPR